LANAALGEGICNAPEKLRQRYHRNHTMFSTARRRCARSLLTPSKPKTDSLPLFLLPAFQVPAAARGFASTSPCQSKIGSAPLSIPPGVTFKVTAPSARGRGARAQAMSTVQIKGPLGELSMDVPAYVNINQDPALSGPTLTVEDATDKKQKAMWGAHPSSYCRAPL
jgi:large subunit ribosomal protein L6